VRVARNDVAAATTAAVVAAASAVGVAEAGADEVAVGVELLEPALQAATSAAPPPTAPTRKVGRAITDATDPAPRCSRKWAPIRSS
jgi:hypothetical protein